MRSDFIDITGQRFGRLTVVEIYNHPTQRGSWFVCKCDCGKTRINRGYDLRIGNVVSCGCKKKGSRHDLTGLQFGKWTVLGVSEKKTKKKGYYWKCVCACGTERLIAGSDLRSGGTRSCGCRSPKPPHVPRKRKPVDPIRESLRNRYDNIKYRCYSPKCKAYKNYGARGITVCDEWKHDFNAFYEWSLNNGFEMGLELDRIDNDKGYSPDNCRYVTHSENNRNKRDNHLITFNGETKTLVEWSEVMNMDYATLDFRLRNGWNTEKALTTPVNKALRRHRKIS